jgi:hypothetical protein
VSKKGTTLNFDNYALKIHMMDSGEGRMKGERMSEKGEPSADDKPIVASDKPSLLPAGTIKETDPNSWYYLKVNYTDQNGYAQTGYAYPVANNASTSFWDYVIFVAGGPQEYALRFQPRPADGGWQYWAIHDDVNNSNYHLDCKATGFL